MIEAIRAWIRDLLDPYPYVRRVIVVTKTDRTFRGVLWQRRRGFIVLREASLLEHGKQVPVDGELVIDRANVDFIQVLSAVEVV